MKIKTKIYLSFLFIIAVGYIVLYGFSLYQQDRLISQKSQQLYIKAQEIAQKIEQKISFLKQETQFLTSLEVMDDIVAKDIDRRILRLLSKRSKTYNNELAFIVTDTQGDIIAHTQNAPHITVTKKTPGLFRTKNWLVIKEPIFASFDRKKKLGFLLTLYPLANLESLLPQKGDVLAWFSSKLIHFKQPAIPVKDLVEVKLQLPFPFNDITLHYALLKQQAFSAIQRLMLAIDITFFIMLILIIIFLFIVSKEVIEPISSLAQSVRNIVQTKEFQTKIPTKRNDEIGELIDSFNELFMQISRQMEHLTQQTQTYESLLLELINFFNVITSTTNVHQTINLSTQELSKLLKTTHISFHKTKPPAYEGYTLTITMHTSLAKETKPFGYIHIKDPQIPIDDKHYFFESIARLISLQLERIALFQELQNSLEAKSRFLSLISHDLKTPLSSILSLTQYLFKELADTHYIQAVVKIEQAGYRLLTQINDLLEFSKLQNNKIRLSIEEFDLASLIQEVLSTVEPLAHDKELTIEKNIPARLVVKSDQKLIKAILYNLLSNAIKYSDHGTITVEIQKEKENIKVIVKDEGRGIDKNELERIFDPFYSVGNAKDSTGLGLAIAKEYAKLLGGELTLESQGLGKGTVALFTFRSF